MSSVLDAGNVDENADRGGTICVDLGGWPSPICGGCWWMFRVGGYACAPSYYVLRMTSPGHNSSLSDSFPVWYVVSADVPPDGLTFHFV